MKAKKSLGQNFLNSKTIAHDIVRVAELSPGETVLEIGPGKGFLTRDLLATGAHVIAVEKDDRMISLLAETFREALENKRLTLVHGDILDLEAELEVRPRVHAGGRTSKMRKEVGPPYKRSDLQLRHYKIVANIPYYITGQILRLFLEADRKPDRMILMLQKEVADRIVARDKKESILSIAVKAYGVPRIVKKVPARYFTPAPKVDSAVLAIEHIAPIGLPSVATEGNPMGARALEEHFFKIVKMGFAHKRRQIAGNLKELFGSKTEGVLAQAGIAPSTRAEDVTLGEWLNLASLV